MRVLTLLVFFLGGFGIFAFEFNSILNGLPENNPAKCLDENFLGTNKNIIVNIGDSITHGVVSGNYSKLVEDELAPLGFTTINAGINADLSHTVLRRIDQVIMCKPKVVTLLIGTNDIIVSESDLQFNSYLFMNRITQDDTADLISYQKNISEIVKRLRLAGVIHIYLISPPIFEEDLSSDKNKKAKIYSDVVRKIAEEEAVSYIPLNEIMRTNIPFNKISASDKKINGFMNYFFIARHYYLDESLDELYQANGYEFSTDGVHLNSNGANLVKSLMLESFKAENVIESSAFSSSRRIMNR